MARLKGKALCHIGIKCYKYTIKGWDEKNGKPLPETLKN
jgi:hypothetical protein